ncbi:MAG: Crp/Fnr family transcriptional regulator [Gammaproteobacteria bacterium]|nr:Crp/Fnr family transcriptional regulator [Gammaproteobacteria bacterium]
MFPVKKSTKKLLEFYRNLPDEVAEQLLDYAEFLALRHSVETKTISSPEDISRPEKESVVVAVKRLTTTYPMLNMDKLLDKTASLVSQNMLQGRDAIEVIDELEIIFRRHYEILVNESQEET